MALLNQPQNTIIKTFIKYAFIGAFATLIDWAVFYVLGVYLAIYYLLAVSLSFLCGATIKFFINKKYTFKNKAKKTFIQYNSFVLLSLVSLAASIGLMYVLVDIAHYPKFISRAITTMIVLFLNFFFDKMIVYNEDVIR